ncbi:MAG: response regulator [Magnetococcales bacterium]|nr:response regulator [Magnetococcales bacterium]
MANKKQSEEKPLIFVVDDDTIFQEILALFLENNGYGVKRIDSGFQVVELCDSLQPDLIMMDAIMPEMDGFSTCQKLKENPNTADIPVIMVTGNDDTKSVEKAFASGAEEFITKPIHWPVLRQRVRIYLERKKSQLAMRASEERFRSVTNSTIDAIISADEKGRIVFWNKGAENVFGYRDAEILGQSVTKLMPKRFRKEHLDGFNRLVNTGISKFQGNTIELIGVRNDGSKFPLEISITSSNVAEKRYISAVLRDITERKRVLGNREGVALFDTHIIEQIYSLWRQVASRDAGQLSFIKLKIIMEMVFLAGIQKEEGEPIRLAVSLLDRGFLKEDENYSDNSILVFDQSLPFVLDSLVKLASGFDPDTTVFAVSGESDQTELKIWGVVFTSKRGKTRLDPYPFIPEPLDVLTVSSIKAGSLTISWGGRVLANFNSGHFSETSLVRATSCPLAETMLKGIRDHKAYKKGGNAYWSVYQEMIRLMVREAAKRCHGGTIIWLPEKQIGEVEKSLLTKYPTAQNPNIPASIAHLCLLERERERGVKNRGKGQFVEEFVDVKVLEDTINECKKRLVDHLEFLAQLTRVDGALILSHKMTTLSFGAVLTAPQWKGNIEYFQPSLSDQIQQVNLTNYGTRHISAVNFVGRYPGVVAIVISQDGPISCLIRKDKETVLWLPDYLNSDNGWREEQ